MAKALSDAYSETNSNSNSEVDVQNGIQQTVLEGLPILLLYQDTYRYVSIVYNIYIVLFTIYT